MTKVHVGLITLLLGVALMGTAMFATSVGVNGRVAVGVAGFIFALCGAAGADDGAL